MVCNRFKGTNVSSVDVVGVIVPLFNPRSETWEDHFRLVRAMILPLTSTGEATTQLLRLNSAERVIERRTLQLIGSYPSE
jgi:hypothetical protein